MKPGDFLAPSKPRPYTCTIMIPLLRRDIPLMLLLLHLSGVCLGSLIFGPGGIWPAMFAGTMLWALFRISQLQFHVRQLDKELKLTVARVHELKKLEDTVRTQDFLLDTRRPASLRLRCLWRKARVPGELATLQDLWNQRQSGSAAG